MDVIRDGSTLTCLVVIDQVWNDFTFAQKVQAELRDGDTAVILDLAHIDLLHSPGLANLVSLHIHCLKRGIAVSLRRVNQANRKLLRSTRLDQLLQVID